MADPSHPDDHVVEELGAVLHRLQRVADAHCALRARHHEAQDAARAAVMEALPDAIGRLLPYLALGPALDGQLFEDHGPAARARVVRPWSRLMTTPARWRPWRRPPGPEGAVLRLDTPADDHPSLRKLYVDAQGALWVYLGLPRTSLRELPEAADALLPWAPDVAGLSPADVLAMLQMAHERLAIRLAQLEQTLVPHPQGPRNGAPAGDGRGGPVV